ncbi:hypothetical protein HU200_006347 [Digitaria exilis]|uniref:Uncharacterized protein n=1 Tax=Digitaria exilis TaxID=1010633 RepID=A0A835FQL6_9POAL|nr:hypothetical protein HU200_006347 [Digitaria exilis]
MPMAWRDMWPKRSAPWPGHGTGPPWAQPSWRDHT